MAMLEVKDLEVYYGMIQAIKGVSFEVNKGEVIALIGANGTGKTTILHTVTGLLSPSSSRIASTISGVASVPNTLRTLSPGIISNTKNVIPEIMNNVIMSVNIFFR